MNAIQRHEYRFHTPEAASGKNGCGQAGTLWHQIMLRSRETALGDV
jgi:hypothetical protein